MKSKPSRPALDEEQIQRCHNIVDDLIRLHKETDPEIGTENYKTEKAYQAINQIGMLSALLTGWAESHILGCYHYVAKSESQWIDDATSNSHLNEMMWHLDEYHKALFSDEKYLMCMRTGIAAIIRNSYRLSGATAWRMAISESIQALNDGQVDWLLTPTNTNLQGDAHELSKLKYAAINHVYKLMGEGWKKTAAQQKVAECCGTTFEAIKKWEKVVIQERDRDKTGLKGMQRGAAAITLFRKDPEYNETDLRIVAVNACIENGIDNEEAREKRDFFCDITFCFKLNQDHPLETLKERLIEAGMRKSN
jgi:hypothetical protein